MKKYKYQMHVHTFPCSDCARMAPEELVNELHIGGYSGCVITNHFINGNSGIDRRLPWNEFVKAYEDDYKALKIAAEKYDVDIIFGIEEGVGNGLEILCYGITPEVLYSHPELRERSIKNWSRVLHENGALCIQAHPFRHRDYITNPGALPLEYIDGVEVYNACNNAADNNMADEFAKNNPQLIQVSGADAHDVSIACVSGIETDDRIKDGKTLVEILKSGNYRLIK